MMKKSTLFDMVTGDRARILGVIAEKRGGRKKDGKLLQMLGLPLVVNLGYIALLITVGVYQIGKMLGWGS